MTWELAKHAVLILYQKHAITDDTHSGGLFYCHVFVEVLPRMAKLNTVIHLINSKTSFLLNKQTQHWGRQVYSHHPDHTTPLYF